MSAYTSTVSPSVLATSSTPMTWQAAMTWANQQGGRLPFPGESLYIKANSLAAQHPYWTNESRNTFAAVCHDHTCSGVDFSAPGAQFEQDYSLPRVAPKTALHYAVAVAGKMADIPQQP